MVDLQNNTRLNQMKKMLSVDKKKSHAEVM